MHRSANGRIRSKLVTLTWISTRNRVLRRVALGVRTSIEAKRAATITAQSFAYCVRFGSWGDGDQGNHGSLEGIGTTVMRVSRPDDLAEA